MGKVTRRTKWRTNWAACCERCSCADALLQPATKGCAGSADLGREAP